MAKRHPIVIDAGPLIAIANRRDEYHQTCMDWRLTVANRRLVVPAMVLAEVCYFTLENVGAEAEAKFIESLIVGEQWSLASPDNATLRRMVDLMRKYADMPLGAADASVVATAEGLGTPEIATLDRKHLGNVRPNHVPRFTLHPFDA